MIDVARKAGVSQSTVSFVLNNRADIPVAPETRERVLQAAAELQFRPNKTAQSLRLNSSSTLGIVTNGIASEPYAGQTLLGIQQAARDAGFVCMVVETSGDPTEGDAAVASMIDRGVEGLVYASPATIGVHASAHLSHTPVVFANCWPINEADPLAVIVPDEYSGGYKIAKAVFDAGHERVAFLGGTAGQWATVERRRGFVDAARDAGIDPAGLAEDYGIYSTHSGFTGTLRILEAYNPTAIVCGNDRMALGAILALHSKHLEVPGDVTVVGYDDQVNLADELTPGLTTVALPFFRMGYIAGQTMLKHERQQERIVVDCEVVFRESLGPVPGQ
jgi:LacI family transcriptional regulator